MSVSCVWTWVVSSVTGDSTSATSSPHNAAPTGTGAGQHDGLPRGSAQWVLQTFDAVERRVAREGLMTGVTLFEGSIN